MENSLCSTHCQHCMSLSIVVVAQYVVAVDDFSSGSAKSVTIQAWRAKSVTIQAWHAKRVTIPSGLGSASQFLRVKYT
jgi:hypothetical protein